MYSLMPDQKCNERSIKFVFYVVGNVNFEQSAYSVGEGNGSAQPVLVLSNPSSTNITIKVNFESSASGMYIYIAYEMLYNVIISCF